MVNSFILYHEWLLSCNIIKAELRKVTQTEFCTQVIKQMIANLVINKSGDKITPPYIPKCTSAPGLVIQRLTGRDTLFKKLLLISKKLVLVDHAKFVFLQNTKRTNEMVLNANALGMKVVMNVETVV